MQSETNAIINLLRISNRDDFESSNSHKVTKKCNCKQLAGNEGLAPWLTESEMMFIKRCKSGNTNSYECIYTAKEKSKKDNLKAVIKPKDIRGRLTKSNSYDLKDTCLKFYHFEDVCEYMTQYRENITLPVLMQYRTKLSRPTCGQEECELSLKECNCAKKAPVIDNGGWLSVAYVKQIESTLANHCYCDPPGISVRAIIEQVKHRSSPAECNMNKIKKNTRKDYCNRTRSDGKLKRHNVSPPMKCFQRTVVLGKNGASVFQRKNNQQSLRVKTGCDNVEALRVISASKMNIGPRMGSNYPPNDKKDISINRFTPNTTHRRKLTHAAIPRRSTSFQACIVPYAPSNSEISQ